MENKPHEVKPFNSDHPIYTELDKLGYIPPNSTDITIELPSWDIPVIKITAYGGIDLAGFIQHLHDAKVELTIIDERPTATEKTGITEKGTADERG